MPAEDLAALLAHADWLRDLARKLVGGAAADDAVQDTFVAALKSPPDPTQPAKPWLARVLRNASRMAYRSDARRTRREDAVSAIAVPPTTSAADTVARAETFRMLVELVLALDDPYRTTLLRHYFDGETFAAIARRDGIPEATVRGRHKQALEQLRRRLDARSHGDRRAWLASLAPLAAPPAHTTAITVGVIIVKKLVVVAVIAILAAGAIWHWYPRTSAAPTLAGTAAANVNAGTPAYTAPTTPAVAPPQHVRKLASADARRELAAQIAAAQASRKAARTAHHSSLGPAEATDQGNFGSGHEADMDKDVIRGAMHEVLPFLADCYGDARGTTLAADHLEVRARFTLTGDPDIGTLIDAKQLQDDAKRPLPAKLDDCMRAAIQSLELPPLGDGDTIEVDYPLMFSDGPPPGGSGSGSGIGVGR